LQWREIRLFSWLPFDAMQMPTFESDSGNPIEGSEIGTMIKTRQNGIARVCRAALAMWVPFALIGASALAQTPSNSNAEVLAANARFYVAINAMFKGDVGPIEAVWSHGGDVTYMGPTGNFETGWSAVLKDWEGQAAQKLGGKVEPIDVQVIVGHDLAVINDYEQGENTNAEGKVQQVRLRATNIFRKEGGQWKMIGHHTDVLPYLAK
jgi:ketosteroid isomerase-like protein